MASLVCIVLCDRTFPRVAFLPADTPDIPVIQHLAALTADGANDSLSWDDAMNAAGRAFLDREFPQGKSTSGETERWAAWAESMHGAAAQAIPAGAIVTAMYVLDRQFIEV